MPIDDLLIFYTLITWTETLIVSSQFSVYSHDSMHAWCVHNSFCASQQHNTQRRSWLNMAWSRMMEEWFAPKPPRLSETVGPNHPHNRSAYKSISTLVDYLVACRTAAVPPQCGIWRLFKYIVKSSSKSCDNNDYNMHAYNEVTTLRTGQISIRHDL